MLTTRQINTLFPFMSEKNNNNVYRSRISKCLFGIPEKSDDLFKKEFVRYRETFIDKWDYDIDISEPVQFPKNYEWSIVLDKSESLCNSSETNSSENLVISDQGKRFRAADVRSIEKSCQKRGCDQINWDVPLKKKRQLQISDIWKEKKSVPALEKAA